jgi:hypothetical protein
MITRRIESWERKSEALARIRKEIDLVASRNISIDDIRTVCLVLGPYRNLTTLTAATLFLHPNCQVLNHAGRRLFGDRRLDFFLDYSDEKFQRFLKYAVRISQGGTRGSYGGSITRSHAFENQYVMKNVFEKTFGGKLVKENIQSLFWKESMRTSNHIRKHHVDLSDLFVRNEQLRFLLPVRNPLDCAVSNLRRGHVKFFEGANRSTPVEQVVEMILDELLWFENLRVQYPTRFFAFFEYEFNRETLVELAQFLELAPLEEWCSNAIAAFDNQSTYRHSNDLLSFYGEHVQDKFSAHPMFRNKLLRFVEGGPKQQ